MEASQVPKGLSPVWHTFKFQWGGDSQEDSEGKSRASESLRRESDWVYTCSPDNLNTFGWLFKTLRTVTVRGRDRRMLAMHLHSWSPLLLAVTAQRSRKYPIALGHQEMACCSLDFWELSLEASRVFLNALQEGWLTP